MTTPPKRKVAPKQNPAPRTDEAPKNWMTSILVEMNKRWIGIVAGAVLISISGWWALSWTYVNEIVDDRLASGISRQLEDKDSALYKDLESYLVGRLTEEDGRFETAVDSLVTAAIGSSFENKVGTLSAGRFALTQAAPAETIYLFVPEGHRVRLLIKVANLETGDSVRVVPRSGVPLSLREEGFFDRDVTELLRSESNDAAISEIIPLEPNDGVFEYLYSLRIQLAINEAGPDANTEIQYVAFVTPALNLPGT